MRKLSASTLCPAILIVILASTVLPATAQVPSTLSPELDQARNILAGLQRGAIDRSLFTDNANSYFSELALKDFASGLAALGTPQEFTQSRQRLRGGMLLRVYRVRFPQKTLQVWTYEMPDGKLEQYQVAVVD